MFECGLNKHILYVCLLSTRHHPIIGHANRTCQTLVKALYHMYVSFAMKTDPVKKCSSQEAYIETHRKLILRTLRYLTVNSQILCFKVNQSKQNSWKLFRSLKKKNIWQETLVTLFQPWLSRIFTSREFTQV